MTVTLEQKDDKRMMSKRLYDTYNVRARGCKLSLLALLTTCFMACSGSGGDDSTDPVVPPTPPTPTEQGKPISFSSGLQEEQVVTAGGSGANSITRATGLETKATSFKVWGYKNDAYDETNGYTSYQTVFPGFTVNWTANTAHTTTSNTHDWEYVGVTADQTIKYWDFSAKAYRYFAVAPATAATASVLDGVASISFSADATTEEKIDATTYYSHLWFKDNSALASMAGNPVTLEFLKPFTLVTVKFIDDKGLQRLGADIQTFTFKPTDTEKKIAVAGNVTISFPLKGTSTQETVTVNNSPTPTYLDADGIKGEVASELTKTVLPATNQGTYTLTVRLFTDANDRSTVVPAEYVNWKPGYAYTYIFKISGANSVLLQVVQVAIRDWSTGSPVNKDLYNW